MNDGGPAPQIDSGRAAREEEFDRFVEKNLRRNFIANFLHGMLGLTGFRLIYAPTFIPAYIQILTGSPIFVGLGQSLLQLGAVVSPIAGASRMESREYILPMSVRIGTLMRVQILGLALAGYFLGGTPLLVATFLFFLLLGLFTGLQRVAFQLVVAKLIPINRRGRLQAWRNLIGGAIAAILSYTAGKYLIEHEVLGNGYATTFLLAFVLTSLGLLALQFGVREPAAPAVRTQMKLRDRVREFPLLLEDRDYRWFVIAQALAITGRVSAPFYILFASDQMPLDGNTIGILSLAFLGADTVSNLFWGYLGDKSGYRITLLMAMAIWILSIALLLAAASPAVVIACFCGFGLASSGYMMSVSTMVLEFGQREDIPMRIAFSTTIEGTILTVGPILAGGLIYLAGYAVLLFLTMALLCLGFAILLLKVVDPRHRAAVRL